MNSEGEAASTKRLPIGTHARRKSGFKNGKSARPKRSAQPPIKCPESLVYVRYRDHVLYHRGDPALMKPQIREAVGWLVYDCQDYVIICWDRDASPPTLRGGDPKASGLVLLRSDILELRKAM